VRGTGHASARKALRRQIADLKLEAALFRLTAEDRRRLAVLEARYRNLPLGRREENRLRREMLRDSEHFANPFAAPPADPAGAFARLLAGVTARFQLP
jgi:hypothetical protein